MTDLKIYDTYNRENRVFKPLNHPFVGIYICGPTVYGHPHLGHARGPVVFDVLHRFLIYKGFKVRFVRNVTDVGHLVNDADEGEDKIAKKARVEQLEPMEIAQFYTDSYHKMLHALNIRPASIEPRASGHIIEQIEMISKIIENGFAYESNGSVYFDVIKYSSNHDYGKLSGRILEDLIAGAGNEARDLEGQDEKHNPNDFALWKKAGPEHIMRWPSPWSEGFPGWHIECSAMSRKYLGDTFDIHGGGMDLLFPHHESEIAQSQACTGHQPANYWMHHNMITVNGQKMAKSLNNGISIEEFFSGKHPLLEKAYSPMTLKFFILQAQYRGTLDFSNAALQASEKGLSRLLQAGETLEKIKPNNQNDLEVTSIQIELEEALNEDLNTPILIAKLFDLVTKINQIDTGQIGITLENLEKLKVIYKTFVHEILGLENEKDSGSEKIKGVLEILIELRNEAKSNKNYELSDVIRKKLTEIGIELKDGKEGTSFSIS
ncbi:MAG: cysteine--tRNA ligase [Bacteroidia bacterium]|nr:cysteine--tRNA ligase [Bacteroidia bacterium]